MATEQVNMISGSKFVKRGKKLKVTIISLKIMCTKTHMQTFTKNIQESTKYLYKIT